MLNKLQKEGVYKAIFERRDIRKFTGRPISEQQLENILLAGHHAPSVGFMQPWNYIIIESANQREAG